MGLLIDTGIFILWERTGRSYDFTRWSALGEAKLSVVTASELLVGVWRANSPERMSKRQAFVEAILGKLPITEVTLAVARVHARLQAELLLQGTLIGAHDLWIAATALHEGDAVLTTNVSEFSRVQGLQVIDGS